MRMLRRISLESYWKCKCMIRSVYQEYSALRALVYPVYIKKQYKRNSLLR